jgi:alpha-D-ribose 1-methylphosphonate 5-triphosphate synthase subunit PhnH
MGVDLNLVCKGFDDPVKDSQRCFRTVLNAVSQPGSVGHLDEIPLGHAPKGWTEAAWALAMTLLDWDTLVWLSPSLATAAAYASLQFHASCPITLNSGEADFVFVGNPNEQPDWSSLRHGEAEFPDLSATVILQIPGMGEESSVPMVALNVAGSSTWELQGPGIEHTRLIKLEHGPEDQWPEQLRHALVANRAQFPLGVDLLLVWRDRVCALARSTRVAAI